MHKLKSFLIILLIAFNTNAKPFTTADLTQSAISKDCLDYCIDGVCFWLKCSFWGCYINTTPHITHNLPDFVVTSYSKPGDNPFTEVSALDYKSKIEGGDISTRGKNNDNLVFKESSVIGNPVAYAMSQQPYLCQSDIEPLMPYYLSTLDNKMWRSGTSDLLYASTYTPGMNEVGPFFGSWGSVYPRVGFLHQGNDYKASAVMAERSLAVVNEGGLRIYQRPQSNASFKSGGKWQMISPKQENSCKAFGTEDHQNTLNKKDDDEQYGWTAWRRYSCCIPGAGSHIGTTITGCLN